MSRRMAALCAAAMFTFALTAGAMPPETLGGGDSLTIYVDGVRVRDDGLSTCAGGELIAPLRAVCEALGAEEVIWDRDADAARVTAPGLTVNVPFGEMYFEANGRYFYIPGGVRVIRDRCVLPLEHLATAFGANMRWDAKNRAAYLETTGKPIESGDDFYGEEDLYWLSRIIQAEAGGEPFEGKLAVGNVVMNRVATDGFPDTVKSVIFDNRSGIQFSPAYSGSIHNTPSAHSVIAAKLALEGFTVVPGGLYFNNYRITSSWASRNREFLVRIGNHVFFA